MIRAGSLRKKVTREAFLSSGQDSIGEVQGDWEAVGTHRVAIEPITQRSKELFVVDELRDVLSLEVTMRYCRGVTPKQRLLYGARILSIETVIDKKEDHRELLLLCSENLNEG